MRQVHGHVNDAGQQAAHIHHAKRHIAFHIQRQAVPVIQPQLGEPERRFLGMAPKRIEGKRPPAARAVRLVERTAVRIPLGRLVQQVRQGLPQRERPAARIVIQWRGGRLFRFQYDIRHTFFSF